MAALLHAACFPSIDEIVNRRNQCCYWIPTKERHCLHPIGLDTSAYGRLQRQLIVARRPESPSTRQVQLSLIEELLQRYCCKQHSTKILPGTSLGREIRCLWRDQLENPPSEHTVFENEFDTASAESHEKLNVPPVRFSSLQRVVSGYNTRSTKSADPSETRKPDGPDHAPSNGFLPMKKQGKTVAQKLLTGPITDYARRRRHLYLYIRLSSPEHCKIGASVDIENRLNEWQQMCRYKPILKHSCLNVSCAAFVEGLIHSELLPKWRREIQCRDNPDCHKQHKEWFEVTVESGSGAMDRWVKWMRDAEPYDATYRLKPEWRSIIENMERKAISVTSQRLLDSMKDLHLDVVNPPAEETAATLEAGTASKSSINETAKASTDTTMPLPTASDSPDATNLLSTFADIISSLTPEQKRQIRTLLDREIRSNNIMPLPRPVHIAAVA